MGGWGRGGLDDLGEIEDGLKDPNYCSDDETVDTPTGQRKTKRIATTEILDDYLASGDVQECLSLVSEAKFGNHVSLVKKAMTLSIEKQPHHRELVSQLFAALSQSIVPEDQFCDAFQTILNQLEEISIDIPQCVDMTGKFLARAVIDEVVPPSFLKTCDLAHIKAEECVTLTTSTINQRHRTHRIVHIWGPADLVSIKRLKEEMRSILEEYTSNKDKAEAERCLNGLALPHSRVHFVIQGIRLATAEKQHQQSVVELFQYLLDSGVIGSGQIQQAFSYVEASVDDLKLDAPNAPAQFEQFKALAQQQGWLATAQS